MSSSRIAILGAGEVGSTIAYALVLNPVAGQLLLVDPQEALRDAQVQDLADASHQGDSLTKVRAGTHQEAGQCDMIVITAGAKQKKGKYTGESRTDLIGRNVQILESSIQDMKPLRPDAIVLVVANPVDVLTHFAQQLTGLPRTQVFGSGTVLDSARLRGLLAHEYGLAASAVSAYVLGEHGDSQVVAWSQVSMGGVPLARVAATSGSQGGTGTAEQKRDRKMRTLSEGTADRMAKETKEKAAEIIASKGSTAFGIGGVVASICKSVLYDGRTVLPVSHYQEDWGVCLSTPVVVGRQGLVDLGDISLSLDEGEKEALKASAKSLKEVIQEAEKS